MVKTCTYSARGFLLVSLRLCNRGEHVVFFPPLVKGGFGGVGAGASEIGNGGLGDRELGDREGQE